MYINIRKLSHNVVFFLVTLAFAYYHLLMTSNLSHNYTDWDYFILISFSFFYVLNLCVFWIDLDKLPMWQSLFFLTVSPLFTSVALIENPVKLYMYYLRPLFSVFDHDGIDIFTYLKYFGMDKYYMLVFQVLVIVSALKFFTLIIFRKKYK